MGTTFFHAFLCVIAQICFSSDIDERLVFNQWPNALIRLAVEVSGQLQFINFNISCPFGKSGWLGIDNKTAESPSCCCNMCSALCFRPVNVWFFHMHVIKISSLEVC